MTQCLKKSAMSRMETQVTRYTTVQMMYIYHFMDKFPLDEVARRSKRPNKSVALKRLIEEILAVADVTLKDPKESTGCKDTCRGWTCNGN